MSWSIIAILIILGLLFLVIEILVLPGATVGGIIGFILLGVAIWQTYATHGSAAGHIIVAATFVLTVLTLYLSLKSRTWNRAMLHDSIAGRVNLIDEKKIKVGDTGKSVSRINPSGKAIVNGEYYEVRSLGEYIDQNQVVEVVKININQIIVKLKT